jgi:flagellar export protein FliJ
MSGYATLVRLNKWKVDERSRALSKLLAEVTAIEETIAALLAEVEEEKRVAAESLEAGALFAAYVSLAHDRRCKLEDQKARLERRINVARDELRVAMGEAKKFEIAEDNLKARERAARKAKDDSALDEAALNGFRRKEKE